MTEKEAIVNLKLHKNWHLRIKGGAIDIAIQALEEIQQYRKIGTVEECREAAEKQKAKKPNIYKEIL